MAEEKKSAQKKSGERKSSRRRRESDGKKPSREKQERGSNERLSGAKLAQRARQELSEITGLEPESVTSLERGEDGWLVTVELLELSRIPDTDDILGSYEAELDESGELLAYRRLRRYPRSQSGAEQGIETG
jgi:Gas vesicle synthesis protein GvpO